MKLDDGDKKILDGAEGPAKRMAMEMLEGLGKVYGAEKLIPVKSAHVSVSFRTHGDAGLEWVEEIAATGAKVNIPTTTNPMGLDRSRDLRLPAEWCSKQLLIYDGYMRMGCHGTASCTPYFCGFIPQYKEHIAWSESSAVIFINSVLGARNNREGAPSAFAAGLIGKTPYYGLHQDENRRAQILFKVTARVRGLADIGAMGAYVGRILGTRTPAFSGLHPLTMEDHVYLGAALASSGGAALYHVLGQTPDALVAGDNILVPGCEVVELGQKELEHGYERLTSNMDRIVDFVAIGCPHLTLNQVAEVAALLDGKKVKPGVTVWIHTNVAVKAMATQLGLTQIIERSGAVLTQDICTINSIPEALGLASLATNSAKMAFYAPGANKLKAWYGSLCQCIEAGVTGTWKG
ncbi:MAG: aconitase X catalytic domain-containing protein [Desulfovibrionaceae bacterium]|nr:aconitase X catalytic domain-containing protein [Desulfovibrionaceae bacterium]